MKVTDYCPRAAFTDVHIKPYSIGVEVGCDVGAHAEALLSHSSVKHLTIIDLWLNPFCEGYCIGRLSRWYNKIKAIKDESKNAVRAFANNSLDFVYIDISHDDITVFESLAGWYDKIKIGGVLGYRNYSSCKGPIDDFIKGKKSLIDNYHNEIVIWKM